MLVSIVIPCYNGEKYLEKAIQSAFDQDYIHKEIIVVDDGSNLETKTLINSLKSKVDKVIVQENSGICIARNVGIAAAKGDLILTLDCDDYFENSFISKAVKLLEQDEMVGIVTCFANLFDDKGVYEIQKPKGGTANNLILQNNSYACVLFRKICWKAVGGYDENMKKGYEDWEFNIAVTKAGWKIQVIPEPLFFYRNTPSSRNKTIQISDNISLLKYIYYKHKDLYLEHFEDMVDFVFNKLEDARKKEIKTRTSLEYRIGKLVLAPLKFLKRLFP